MIEGETKKGGVIKYSGAGMVPAGICLSKVADGVVLKMYHKH
jgi:hypothetical protein